MTEITDVVLKTYYDEAQEAYFLSVTTCVTLLVNTSATNLVLEVAASVENPHIFIEGVSNASS